MKAARLFSLFVLGAVLFRAPDARSTVSDPNNPGEPISVSETLVNSTGGPMNRLSVVMAGSILGGGSDWPATVSTTTNPTTLNFAFSPPVPAGTEITITWATTTGADPTDKWWNCVGLPCHIYDARDLFPLRYDPSWLVAQATMALPDSTSPFIWVGAACVDYYVTAPPASAIADTTLPPGVIRHVILPGSVRVNAGDEAELRDPHPPVGNYRSVWRYTVDGVPGLNSPKRDRKAVLNPPPFSVPSAEPPAVVAIGTLLLLAGALALRRRRLGA